MKKRNITITNLTDDQFEWLKKEAEKSGMPISGLIKHWCQTGVDKEKDKK